MSLAVLAFTEDIANGASSAMSWLLMRLGNDTNLGFIELEGHGVVH